MTGSSYWSSHTVNNQIIYRERMNGRAHKQASIDIGLLPKPKFGQRIDIAPSANGQVVDN